MYPFKFLLKLCPRPLWGAYQAPGEERYLSTLQNPKPDLGPSEKMGDLDNLPIDLAAPITHSKILQSV